MRIDRIATAAVLSLLLASPAVAQQGLPFAGCWAPADGLSSRDRLCITPTGTNMLEVTSITADGKATESQLSLDGTRIAVKSEDCQGWEEGRLTDDGERIIVSAELTCGREPTQVRSTAFTITPSGYLLQATGTGLAMVAKTTVRLFGPVDSYADIPQATRELLMPHLVAGEAARLGVRGHTLSAKDLVEFEEMGVAAPIIDVMVAASYPKSFVIDGLGEVASTELAQGNAVERPRRLSPYQYMNGYPMLSMYDWQMMYECRRLGFFNYSNGFGCGSYGMLGYGGFGYNGFGFGGYGYGGYGGYGIPVVVRPVTPAPSAPGGRAIRGRGYTQTGNDNSGGTASPRTSVSAGASSSASAHSGGSGGSSGASSSGGSSSGSTARTAKPRP